MADSILRLKVESQEYDNKLKQATNGLTRYVDECRKVGGTLEVVEKETLDYVRALGQMDTTSRTATGKLAEMKKTFVELSAQYKQMTDAEKQSPFGKALSQSLDQLKGRIQEGKSQLDDINKSINGGGGLSGALDNIAGKFSMSVQSLASWGTALAAARGALEVAKDAFFASEATVDEWGRVMDSSKSLYEGFLTALNTGDISGFLSRIDSIVQAARAAYNELDRLGTMKTIQAPQMSAQQTENERMRMMIQTGRYIAPVDGRKASMQNGQLLTPEQIKRIEQQLQNGMQKVVTLVGNEVAQTGRAIDAVYNRQAQELGMSLKEFRKGTSSMAEFDKRMAGYEKYKEFESAHTVTSTFQSSAGAMVQSRRDNVANPYAEFAKWGTFRVDGQRYNDLVKLIQQRDQQAGQAYSMQSQAYRTMNRAEGVTLRQIMGGGSGGGGGAGGFDINRIAFNPPSDTDKLKPSDYAEVPSVWAMFGKEIGKSLMEGIEDPMSNLQVDDFIKSYQAVEDHINDMNNALAQQKMAYNMAGQAAQNFGAALAATENPAAKTAGTVMQAVASIALGFAMASSNANTAGTGWGWLAWLGAGMAAMATTISTIHSLTGYAQGGMIKGNSYSGDNIGGVVDGSQLVGLNAGEIVLNQAQTSNVANALKGGGMGNMHLTARLDGKDLLLSIDRTGQTMGYGQLVFFK